MQNCTYIHKSNSMRLPLATTGTPFGPETTPADIFTVILVTHKTQSQILKKIFFFGSSLYEVV